MKQFHLIWLLSRNMLWRVIPLMLVLFFAGVLGVSTAVLVYDQALPASCFDTPQTQDLLFFDAQNPTSADPTAQMKQKDTLHATLLANPDVKEIYYRKGFYVEQEENHLRGVLYAHSAAYLNSLHWPLRDRISFAQRNPDALAVWADAALRSSYRAGDTFSLEIDDYGMIVQRDVQIVGFLPLNGMYPDGPFYALRNAPSLSSLYQFADASNGNGYVFIAALEDVIGLFDADLALQRTDFYLEDSSFPSWLAPFGNGVVISALRASSQAAIPALEKHIRQNGQGVAYTIREIIQSDRAAMKAALKRNSNNLFIFFYIIFCGIGALQFSLILRKRKQVAVLRLLGVSWRSIRLAWLWILMLSCGIICAAGCILCEYFSSPIDAMRHLLDVPWLRFVPVGLILLLTLIINLVSFAGWKHMEEQEMRRTE